MMGYREQAWHDREEKKKLKISLSSKISTYSHPKAPGEHVKTVTG